MKIEYCYEPGGEKPNEDAVVIRPDARLFAVIDGATGHQKLNGRLAAQAIRRTLEHWPSEGSLLEAMQWAQRAIEAATLQEAGVKPEALLPEERSVAGLVLLRLHPAQAGVPGRAEYVHAGDCMLILQHTGGRVRVVTQDHIGRLDGAAIREMAAIPAAQRSREAILPTLQANRRLLNQPLGYGVMDGTPMGLEYLEHGSVPLIGCEGILLLSDGLYDLRQPVDAAEGWTATGAEIFRQGLASYVAWLMAEEQADAKCERYPRLKASDDKSGIYLSWSGSGKGVTSAEEEPSS